MFNRIFAIAKKEVRQLKRDIRMMFVLFFFPILLLVIFGYAVNFDVRHIKVAVYDRDRSSLSREFINVLTSSDYFDLVGVLESEDLIKDYLDNQKVQCVIVFPYNMSKELYGRRPVKIQCLIDGVNANSATIIRNYLNIATISFSQQFTNEFLAKTGKAGFIPIDLRPVFLFNPELKSTLFLIPGLIVMILIITAVVSIALSIVREKELGTIEQLNVSPLSAFELIIGKTTPNAIISLMVAALILVAGYFMFGITIRGNVFLLLFTTLLYIIACLSLGILVSTISDSQQIAFQIAALISMLPSMILSGFIFPIESMPVFIQILTNITPAKFFMVILRDILIKGVGLESFWPQVIYLIIFTTILLAIAVIRYKRSVQV
jgi:ABC-2 type transport system permease protein